MRDLKVWVFTACTVFFVVLTLGSCSDGKCDGQWHKYAFEECEKLEDAVIPENVVKINGFFYERIALTGVQLGQSGLYRRGCLRLLFRA